NLESKSTVSLQDWVGKTIGETLQGMRRTFFKGTKIDSSLESALN
ncbi:hypothetical protein SCG7086_BC_00180, partial [Chlamydiales bacterium SCGC AG-110-P3]